MRLLTTGALLMTFAIFTAGASLPDEIINLRDQGEYTQARERLAELAAEATDDAARDELLFEAERLRRVMIDFTLTQDGMVEALRAYIPDVTSEQVDAWREEGLLQGRIIDGEMRHFKRDHQNLFRRSAEARAIRDASGSEEPESDRISRLRKLDASTFREQHFLRVIRTARETGEAFVCPNRYRVTYTLTVKPDQVPEGEMIRCWLAIPREESHNRDVELVSTSPAEHILAPADALQRTVYMEQPSRGSEPTVFQEVFEYTAWAHYLDIDPATIEPYDTDSDLYREFTANRPPHILVNDETRALAAEIVGDETNPYLKAQRIFGWVNDNIRWISEREYSTILSIPELCLERSGGDCGVQSLTLISLFRAAGIPARWESGWHPQPYAANMHDWARFYVEPYGWLWADPSMGYYPNYATEEAQHFYFGNIDAHRLVVNCDYSQELTPPKQHFRSETVDFQRGEVEWDGGNLYFDQWEYSFEPEIIEGETGPGL